jgi:hypothetical protein
VTFSKIGTVHTSQNEVVVVRGVQAVITGGYLQ